MLKSRALPGALGAGMLVVMAIPADAGREARRDGAVQVPVKDCTRFNSRFGYYGNPWCTPAEQRAFDRWEARRSGTRDKRR